ASQRGEGFSAFSCGFYGVACATRRQRATPGVACLCAVACLDAATVCDSLLGSEQFRPFDVLAHVQRTATSTFFDKEDRYDEPEPKPRNGPRLHAQRQTRCCRCADGRSAHGL